MDPAQTMLGESLQALSESLGTSVKFMPAEAHWQLGRAESHGGWFGRVLEKTSRNTVQVINWHGSAVLNMLM